jgi:hypothetical protein
VLRIAGEELKSFATTMKCQNKDLTPIIFPGADSVRKDLMLGLAGPQFIYSWMSSSRTFNQRLLLKELL